MIVSLERALSKLGFCSRKEAAILIKEGKVKVSDKVVKNNKLRIHLDSKIEVEGKSPGKQKTLCIMFHKPKNVVTTRKDPEGRKAVFDFIKTEAYLFPVGRLDYDSSGLLLLTNNGKLADFITAPESRIQKVYLVKVKGLLEIRLLEKGVTLDGELLVPKKVELVRQNPLSTIIKIAITEGRNRQIRRMLEAMGSKTLALKRVAVGPLKLRNLKPGEYRELSESEVKKLMLSKGVRSQSK